MMNDPNEAGLAAEASADVASRSRAEERSDEARERTGKTTRPDPEVLAKPKRRQFTAAYRLRIVEEADACTRPGQIGQLLRREGLYSSHLSTWRQARNKGALAGLAPQKRGVKPTQRDPSASKVVALEAEVARLQEELRKAHVILDVQGKVAGLLDINLNSGKNS